MAKFNIKDNLQRWVVCTAASPELVERMKKNEDGTYPVVFMVGGVELDWEKVINELSSQFDNLVDKRAQSLLNRKYLNLIDEIYDITDRIKNHKEKFKWDGEE